MNFKKEKGVTLIVLTITIIVLLIITSITLTNFWNQTAIKDLNNLYSDIQSINTKVSDYYLKNNSLPVFQDNLYLESSSALEQLLSINGGKGEVINPNDGDEYYVLDLSKLENLTLNYGRQYKEWTDTSIYNEYDDLYIINGVTHQIYYPKGKELDENVYFSAGLPTEIIEKISLDDIENNISINTISANKNIVGESDEGAILEATIVLDLNSDFDQSTLKYAWATTNDLTGLNFTKFSVNGDLMGTVMSKQLDNISTYYLFVKVLDVQGKEHIKSHNISFITLDGASLMTVNLPNGNVATSSDATWVSSNTNVATVTNNGIVKCGTHLGTAIINCKDNENTVLQTCAVTNTDSKIVFTNNNTANCTIKGSTTEYAYITNQ